MRATPIAMGKLKLALLLVLVASPLGCAGAPGRVATPDEAPASAEPAKQPGEAGDDELPEAIQELNLSAAQLARVDAMRKRLRRELEPFGEAMTDLMLVTAKAIKKCDADSMSLDTASSWAVTAGEQARGPVLDGIDELHAILTPTQRQQLSDRLLDGERDTDSDDNKKDSARSGASFLGAEVDLSFGQMLVLLERVLALREAAEERMEPWRREFKVAVKAFARPDFRSRDYEFSNVPAIKMLTDLVRDGMRTLLPVFEPEQCVALGDALEKAVHERQEEAKRKRELRGE